MNYLLRNFKGEENINPLKTFKNALGWSVAALFFAICMLVLFVYNVAGFYLQLADLILSLIVIALLDAKWKIIPNNIAIATLLSQVAMSYLVSEIQLTFWSVVGTVIVLLILILVNRISKDQIGMGDVKLLAIFSLVYGVFFVIWTLIISMIVMLVATIPLLFTKKIKLKTEIPFAPFYTIGTVVYILLKVCG